MNRTIHNTNITDQRSIDSYRAFHMVNTTYKCNQKMLTAFGLVGKFTQFGYRNKRAQYCATNGYSCCSSGQMDNAMVHFGKALVNLKKDLEPVIELAVIFKSIYFLKFSMRNFKNKICSNIIERAFNQDPMNKNFNAKRFFKIIFA